MKKIWMTLNLLLMPIVGFAQGDIGSWHLTPKVGVNWATITDPEIYLAAGSYSNEKLEYTSKIGLVAGAEVEYQMLSNISLSAGVLYSNQGTNQKDNQWFRNLKATLHYLNIPITANYYITPNFTAKIGLQPGFALAKRVEGDEPVDIPTDEKDSERVQWVHTSDKETWYKTFDLGMPIGLSYNIGAVQIDARYILGLTNIAKFDALKIHNRTLQVTLGYRFDL